MGRKRREEWREEWGEWEAQELRRGRKNQVRKKMQVGKVDLNI